MKALFALFAITFISTASFAQTVDLCATPAAKSAALATQKIITGLAVQNGVDSTTFAAQIATCGPNVEKVLNAGSFGNSMVRAPICGASYIFANVEGMKQFAEAIKGNSQARAVCLSLHTMSPRH